MASVFTATEVGSRAEVWARTVAAKRPSLDPRDAEWLEAWERYEVGLAGTEPRDVARIRLGHYTGWVSRGAAEFRRSYAGVLS